MNRNCVLVTQNERLNVHYTAVRCICCLVHVSAELRLLCKKLIIGFPPLLNVELDMSCEVKNEVSELSEVAPIIVEQSGRVANGSFYQTEALLHKV